MTVWCIFLFALLGVEAGVIDYVSTLYGTGNLGDSKGNDPTGVQVPFGTVRLSPDTENILGGYSSHKHMGGFDPYDAYIRVFSHLHLVGAGAADFGNIGVMPYRRKKGEKLHDIDLIDYGFKSAYELKSAIPGYFNVHLTKNHLLEVSNINVELTSTKYVGVHRYTFLEEDSENFVLFDISHAICPNACEGAYVEIDPDNQVISGWMINNGDFMKHFKTGKGLKIYFHARTNVRWGEFGIWKEFEVKYGVKNETSDHHLGAFLTGFSSNSVEVYVGISFISLEMARKNLENDFESLSGFDDVKKQTQEEWETELSRVSITPTSTNLDHMKTFYSGFYRTLTAPTLFSESEGDYLGMDDKVHKLDDPTSQRYFTDLSIWDVFRSEFPLISFLRPDVMIDIIRSLLLMRQQGGCLPRWPLANFYTCSMIGNHANIVIVDAYLKGLRSGYNISEAYEAMIQSAMTQTKHCSREIEYWTKYHYIPDDKGITTSVCETLAYAYDDGVLAKMAKMLGKEEDFQTLTNRSMNYKNVFESKIKFFCPRSSEGKFDCPPHFELTDVKLYKKYREGDAWHWRFYAPHDVPGLIDLFGGDEAFVEQLDIFMKKNFEFAPLNYYGVKNPYFWVGNEHNLASPWLFNFAGRPDLTQKYVPEVIKTYYSWKPEGCPGNDDYGETSSWMVFGSLGFYPIAGSTQYSISSPMFEEFSVNFQYFDDGEGKEMDCLMKVKLENFADENIYVQKLTINGREHDLLFFDHIKDFGLCSVELVFVMGKDVPNK